MIKLTLTKTENKVKVNNKLTENFEVKEGVRQGDPLSSLLFNVVLEMIIKEANINRSGHIYHKKHQCLAFADDVVILSRSKEQLKEVVERLEKAAREKGLYTG